MNNKKSKVLLYDFIIITTFALLALAAILFILLQGWLCACFAPVFGPIINIILSLFIIVWLCILNHSKSKNGIELKWCELIFYIAIGLIIVITINIAIQMFNQISDFDLNSKSF